MLSEPEYRQLRFAALPLDNGEERVLHALNQELLETVRRLPPALHTEATLLLMRLSGGPREFNYFRLYYAPAWTVLLTLRDTNQRLSDAQFEAGVVAQALAMFLHLFDDHLTDGQLPINHLTLQLRTEAWTRFESSVERLSDGVPRGRELARELIQDYFAAIHQSPMPSALPEQQSPSVALNEFCELFRRQMATWLIVPLLFARIQSPSADDAFFSDVRSMYEAFGIAWRLFDDVQDFVEDAAQGEPSAVYRSLSHEGRRHWRACRGQSAADFPDTPEWRRLAQFLEQNHVLSALVARVCGELEFAATTADRQGWHHLARQYRALGDTLPQNPVSAPAESPGSPG